MTISRRMQIRRGTTAEWTTRNPVLLAAEPGYEIDTGRLKIGDGAKAWNQLPYYSGNQNVFSITDIEGLADALAGKQPIGSYAAAVHNHDDRYYTETEVTAFLAGKSDTTHTHAAATTNVAGFMSASDKAKLDGIQAGAEVNVNADWNATSGDAQILNKPTIPAAYTLPTASADTLGGVRIGSGISIDGNGVITASVGYTLPDATTTTKGGVIVGTGLGVTAGTVSVTYGTTAGTACQGNDSRLSDSRAPTGAAGGDLTGTYPNPQIAAGAVVTADIANSAVTYAKIQNVSATNRLLGRASAGAGVVEEILCTTQGLNLIGASLASTQRDLLGLGTIATQNTGAVSITGGTINGTSVGATTASTGSFTTVTTTGNVGIGTASPTTRLDVAGADSAISVGTGSYGRYQLSGGNSTGYLYGSFAALADGIHLGYNYYANAAGTGVIPNSGGPTSRVTAGYGFVAFATSSANNTAPTEKVRINGDGNVGIGTASPAANLDVAASVPQVRVSSTGGATGQLLADGSSFYVGPTGAHALRLQTNGATRAIIDSTGNVGIGTASPTQSLHVVRSGAGIVGRFTDNATQTLDIGIVASAGVYIDNPNSGYVDFRIGGSSRMRVDSAGNVGIGTASPGARLDVQGGRSLFSASSEQYAIGARFSPAGGPVFFGAASASSTPDAVISAAGGNSLMTLQNGGNVGIGTASPTISSGVGLHIGGSTMRLDTARTPASSAATGNTGEICWDSSYLYVCVATNSWRRIALSTW